LQTVIEQQRLSALDKFPLSYYKAHTSFRATAMPSHINIASSNRDESL